MLGNMGKYLVLGFCILSTAFFCAMFESLLCISHRLARPTDWYSYPIVSVAVLLQEYV